MREDTDTTPPILGFAFQLALCPPLTPYPAFSPAIRLRTHAQNPGHHFTATPHIQRAVFGEWTTECTVTAHSAQLPSPYSNVGSIPRPVPLATGVLHDQMTPGAKYLKPVVVEVDGWASRKCALHVSTQPPPASRHQILSSCKVVARSK